MSHLMPTSKKKRLRVANVETIFLSGKQYRPHQGTILPGSELYFCKYDTSEYFCVQTLRVHRDQGMIPLVALAELKHDVSCTCAD